jgi:hypothetical protein
MALLNRSSVRKDHNCHQAGNDHLAALACVSRPLRDREATAAADCWLLDPQ